MQNEAPKFNPLLNKFSNKNNNFPNNFRGFRYLNNNINVSETFMCPIKLLFLKGCCITPYNGPD